MGSMTLLLTVLMASFLLLCFFVYHWIVINRKPSCPVRESTEDRVLCNRAWSVRMRNSKEVVLSALETQFTSGRVISTFSAVSTACDRFFQEILLKLVRPDLSRITLLPEKTLRPPPLSPYLPCNNMVVRLQPRFQAHFCDVIYVVKWAWIRGWWG